MAIIGSFDTATLEGLVADLATKEARALAPLPRPADEPNAVQREEARIALQTSLKNLTAYIASIV